MVKPSDIYANPAIARAKAVAASAERITEGFHAVDEELSAIIRLLIEDKRPEDQIRQVQAMQTTFREMSRLNVPELKAKSLAHLDNLTRNRS